MKMKLYAALAFVALVSGDAIGSPIYYSFASGPIRSATGVASGLLPASSTVSGSFTYDPSAPFLGNGLGGATSLYAGAMTDFVLNIGGQTASDPYGYVLVANDLFNVPNLSGGFSPRPWDLLEFYAGPSGPVGWSGLEIGGQSVGRIRFYIEEGLFSTGTPDFLSNELLPQSLPSFRGGLSLDFAPLTGGTAYLGTAGVMLFENLQITAVPEPQIFALFLLGALAIVITRRRRASGL